MTIEHTDRGPLGRHEIAALIAADISRGSYVNLGIGQHTLVADHLDPEGDVTPAHRERHARHGRAATDDEIDPDLINAGKVPVTETAGAARFHHADSVTMMRVGHLDVCVLGAFQVSATGDLANWHAGEPDAIPALGGAMDLAIGARGLMTSSSLAPARDTGPPGA